MKKVTQKTIGIFILSSIVIFAAFNNTAEQFLAQPEVSSVTSNPTQVSQNTNVTVSIEFVNDINITKIEMQYCRLEPDWVCYPSKINMSRILENTWFGSFIVLEERGLIGFKLYINYENATEFIIPDSIDYLGYDNIVEPSTGIFYFSIQVIPPTQSAPLTIGLCGLSASFTTIVIGRKILLKKKKK